MISLSCFDADWLAPACDANQLVASGAHARLQSTSGSGMLSAAVKSQHCLLIQGAPRRPEAVHTQAANSSRQVWNVKAY